MILAGIITFAACALACKWFNTIELPKYIFESVKIVVVGIACCIIYTLLNYVFKVEYLRDVLTRLCSRFKSTN